MDLRAEVVGKKRFDSICLVCDTAALAEKNMLKNKPLSSYSRVAMITQRWQSGQISAKHKVIVAAAASSLFAVFTAVATVQDRSPIESASVVQPLSIQAKSLADTSPTTYWNEERFNRGDTFAALLARLRVDADEVTRALRDATVASLVPQLRPGTSVQAEVGDDGRLHAFHFVGAKDVLLGVQRTAGGFKIIDKPIQLTRQVVSRVAFVRHSLFAAADAAGVPDSIATQLGEVFGTEVDFHRDFRNGDRFTVVYETFLHQGRQIRTGRLLAAEVVQGRRTLRAVWFESGETHGYYAPNGRSLKSAFLRSPLEVSRITSGFEMRFDPRSQQWHAHKGIDYAAPIGTTVRATGDATVHFAGMQQGYGNVVILRHRGDYTTLYAHLHEFAEGIKEGSRVAQGQILGTVGQTGWATGPHLHYEFRIKDEHVDPLNAALPVSTPLEARQVGQFRVQAATLVAQLDLLKSTTVAAAE
jgi:murein DD-endopeptidase MepM/ murein hydrolase activator NlpD